MPEFPDWLRGLALIGQADDDYVVIKAKSTGELYTLIQGEFEDAPKTVVLDQFGNMLVVLKGQFGGELITVKLDADGRLYSYMTDDIDQWGNILPGGFAELAARLGSLAAYERRGQVVVTDSFEYGLGVWEVVADAGYTFELDPVDFIHGGYSVHLNTHTADDDACNFIREYGGVPANVGVGVAFWARFVTPGKHFLFGLNLKDGSESHTGVIKGTVSDKKLWYFNSGGTYTEFGTWVPNPDPYQRFRFFKVAVDTDEDEYLYAVVDGQQYDLRGNACWNPGSNQYNFQASFQIIGGAADPAEAYIDSFVLTTKETGYQIT